jgi:hypothetical protein
MEVLHDHVMAAMLDGRRVACVAAQRVRKEGTGQVGDRKGWRGCGVEGWGIGER